jgi:hypothetical protein
MIAFNNLPGIVAVGVMLASTLGAAAPTTSSEAKAAILYPLSGVLRGLPLVGPLLHGLKSREELDLDLLNSLFGRAEADNEGFFIPDFGTIENIRGTVEFKALPKDVELKARANFSDEPKKGKRRRTWSSTSAAPKSGPSSILSLAAPKSTSAQKKTRTPRKE